jgi:NADPH:quinone reductase-like Zn-dependent oxidoreductase
MEAALFLGASRAIYYRKTDFSREGRTYDLILAANGYHRIDDYLRALELDGRLVVSGGAIRLVIQAASRKKATQGSGGKGIETLSLEQSREDPLFMKELLEEGKVLPLIDASFPLERTADAFRLNEKDHARGKSSSPYRTNSRDRARETCTCSYNKPNSRARAIASVRL